MSSRRQRQQIPSSDEEFDEAPAVAPASESDLSEPDFDDENDENEDEGDEDVEEEDEEDEEEDDNDEDHQPKDEEEDSLDEAFEMDEPEPARPVRSSRVQRPARPSRVSRSATSSQPSQSQPARERSTRPARETKKRQLTFYEEDELPSSEEEPVVPKKKKVSVKLKIPRRAAAKVGADDDFAEENEYAPDISRLTERQRAKLEEPEATERWEDSTFARMDEQLLALNRKTQKKVETAEQIAVRRAENARKRADYKTKQLEEEKRDTLNKLLKRRANKTRENMDDDDTLDAKQTLKPRRPVAEHPALLRWVGRTEGSVLALPAGSNGPF